ncbi:MAG: UDP-N-acetylglucosamine 2-epimerase (non-hydrolyzing) [Bacillota bacterium]
MIRLSLIIPKLDRWADRHILVHTGQNAHPRLKDIFFDELGIRPPDYRFPPAGRSFGRQIGSVFQKVEQLLLRERPDRVLVLGDTNSALCAVLAERMGIPVYHMEAGNRCYDKTVPEEINRKLIDAVASFNLPYTPGARDNLLREGMEPTRIWMSGNPIYEVLNHFRERIAASDILARLGLAPRQYILVTAHRAENVDHEQRLRKIVSGLKLVAEQTKLTVVCSVHPRTKSRFQQFSLDVDHPRIRWCEPFGFFDFVHLQQYARCVITDSGTVQEESCILGVPAVTIRQSTERPETVLCGSNVVAGLEPERIAACVQLMMNRPSQWECPVGYRDPDVSTKVTQFTLGGLHHV